jgi:putative redox protein
MIKTSSTNIKYKTEFTNGENIAFADISKDEGGSSAGCSPHELLEASLACCINMYIRVYAENHNIPISKVTTSVNLDKSNPDERIFEYAFDIQGDLSEDQRNKLINAANACPVKQTLSKKISFKQIN